MTEQFCRRGVCCKVLVNNKVSFFFWNWLEDLQLEESLGYSSCTLRYFGQKESTVSRYEDVSSDSSFLEGLFYRLPGLLSRQIVPLNRGDLAVCGNVLGIVEMCSRTLFLSFLHTFFQYHPLVYGTPCSKLYKTKIIRHKYKVLASPIYIFYISQHRNVSMCIQLRSRPRKYSWIILLALTVTWDDGSLYS